MVCNHECIIAGKFSKTLYSALWFADPSPPTPESTAIFTVTQLQAAYIEVRDYNPFSGSELCVLFGSMAGSISISQYGIPVLYNRSVQWSL